MRAELGLQLERPRAFHRNDGRPIDRTWRNAQCGDAGADGAAFRAEDARGTNRDGARNRFKESLARGRAKGSADRKKGS